MGHTSQSEAPYKAQPQHPTHSVISVCPSPQNLMPSAQQALWPQIEFEGLDRSAAVKIKGQPKWQWQPLSLVWGAEAWPERKLAGLHRVHEFRSESQLFVHPPPRKI